MMINVPAKAMNLGKPLHNPSKLGTLAD